VHTLKLLCKNEQLLKNIAAHHHCCFSELYADCKKESDPFVQLQFQRHQYCSAFLLPRMYTLINLDETAESSLVLLKNRWLDFFVRKVMYQWRVIRIISYLCSPPRASKGLPNQLDFQASVVNIFSWKQW